MPNGKEEDIGENDGNGGKVEPSLRLEAHAEGEQQQTDAGGQAAGQQERPRGEPSDQGDGHQGHGRVEGRTADAAVLGGQVGEAHRAEGLRGVVEDGVDAGQLLAGVQGADHRKGRPEATTIFQNGKNRQLVSIATLATLRLQAHGGHLVQQLQDGALSAQGEQSGNSFGLIPPQDVEVGGRLGTEEEEEGEPGDDKGAVDGKEELPAGGRAEHRLQPQRHGHHLAAVQANDVEDAEGGGQAAAAAAATAPVFGRNLNQVHGDQTGADASVQAGDEAAGDEDRQREGRPQKLGHPAEGGAQEAEQGVQNEQPSTADPIRQVAGKGAADEGAHEQQRDGHRPEEFDLGAVDHHHRPSTQAQCVVEKVLKGGLRGVHHAHVEARGQGGGEEGGQGGDGHSEGELAGTLSIIFRDAFHRKRRFLLK